MPSLFIPHHCFPPMTLWYSFHTSTYTSTTYTFTLSQLCFTFGEVASAQLHHFADASENGYGTVTYLLLQNIRGQVYCAFVMGKARVAPLKSITIPRMELTARVVASRMDKLWRKELQMPLQESVFWTYSTSVLKYIRNETSKFKIFVANWVSEILTSSNSSQWRYVNTSSNPADLASRLNDYFFSGIQKWRLLGHTHTQPSCNVPCRCTNVPPSLSPTALHSHCYSLTVPEHAWATWSTEWDLYFHSHFFYLAIKFSNSSLVSAI